MLIIIIGRFGGAVGNDARSRTYGRGFKFRRKPVIELLFDQLKRL